ncbi:hypothetical protein [Nonomuraea jabiensis]|uniref:hypothetical protein n=1 Tax=Nonomuraea jabiensis TaxID=882448 RepID=UPI00368F6838
MAGRQREEAAQDRRGVAVGDQGGELGSPAAELLDDTGGHGRGIGEIDIGEPVLWLQQLRVRVQGPVTLPISQDPLSRREREKRPGADRLRGGGMAGAASNRKVSTVETPMYPGAASESNGRTRDHAPSAPTSRLATTVVPSAGIATLR